MLVNPINLRTEATHLEALGFNAYELLTVEREALVTTPYHCIANRIRETLRGTDRHGSCGLGIGETVADSIAHPEMALQIGDLTDPETLRKKISFNRELKLSEFAGCKDVRVEDEMLVFEPENLEHYISRLLGIGSLLKIVDRDYLPSLLAKTKKTIIFEGAQGVLLDQDYGFHPHTTWSDTTFGNAYKLLDGFEGPVREIGVLRGYMTRHGAGPFPTELGDNTPLACDIQTDMHNKWAPFQQHFRLGHFDCVLARYALGVIGGVDELFLTNLDKLGNYPHLCSHYWWDFKPGFPGIRQPLRELTIPKPPDLEQQERLGRRLVRAAEPVYETLNSRVELVDRIAEELNTPVTHCSIGPQRKHKFPTQYLRGVQWNS
jgi:adenylosuccinate synthase